VLNGDPWHSDIAWSLSRQRGKLQGLFREARLFFFEAGWLEEEQCVEVVKEGWDQGMAKGLTRVNRLVGRVAGNLSCWSSNVLGVWEKQRKKLKKDLEFCRRGCLERWCLGSS
jgi:hypothetical protein